MDKANSIVIIHATYNVTSPDEFQIKIVPRLELPLLRIGKGVITDHIDVSLIKMNKELYEQKFRVYSKSLSRKHQSLINHVYAHLNLEELKQLILTVEEGRVVDLPFLKTCAECKKECYQETDLVKCRSCAYWIHDNVSCYKFNLKYGKCCTNCYYNQVSNVEDDNNQGELNINNRKYNTADDDILEFHNNVNCDNSEEHSKIQTVVSESCNTFVIKLNRNKSSGITSNEENESLPKTSAIPNIATTTFVEPAMTTDENKNNVNANIVTFDDIFDDENLMKFVFQTIYQLEVQPTNFEDFKVFMKSSNKDSV